nr:FAD-binding protein [Rhodoplanes tepidamans]
MVIGAGGCGLVAALAARAGGAEVAVVEKLDRFAGNTMLSSGSIPAAGTRLQRAAGIDDDPARFAADLRRVAGPHDADPLVDRLAAVSADLVHFLLDEAGVALTLVTGYRHVGHGVCRLHAPPSRRGADLVADLERAAAARDIPIAFGNPAVALLVADGAVRGAVTESAGGGTARIGARAVLLACSGFGQSRPLRDRFCPDMAAIPHFGAIGSEGDAVTWGELLGARLGNMAAFQAHAGVAQPHGALVTWTVIEKGGLVVDDAGARFADESLGYSAFAERVVAHGRPTFAVYDARIRDVTAVGQPEFGELVTQGGARAAATVADLAGLIGCPEAELAATLHAAGEAARGAAADRHGRTAFGLGPLAPPYVVTRIAPALFHTQGGLVVDGDARVLRPDGSAIPGLYAGGGAACGVSGRRGSLGYVSGNGLLSALGLGFLAGRAAARAAAAARAGTAAAPLPVSNDVTIQREGISR